MSPAELRPYDVIDPRCRLAHDRWITFLATTRGIIVALPDELTRYRQYNNNESGWMRSGRSLGTAYMAARDRFAYNLAKHLAAAQRFIEIVQEEHARADDHRREDLGRLLAGWRALATAYQGRLAIAEENVRTRRLLRWAAAVRGGAYGSSVAERPVPMVTRELMLALIARPGQRTLAQSMLPPGSYPE